MKSRRVIGSLLDRSTATLLLVPSVILLFVLLVGPFFYMVGTGFTDLHYALPNRDGSFVGFDNFRRLMQDDKIFWHSFLLTLKFVAWVVSIEFILGFALAMLLFKFIKRRRIALTLLLVPMMIAPVAVGLIWKLLLQGDFGMVRDRSKARAGHRKTSHVVQGQTVSRHAQPNATVLRPRHGAPRGCSARFRAQNYP